MGYATFCAQTHSALFFFSSRRRHTRSLRDWSSDVCSSDLAELPVHPAPVRRRPARAGPLMFAESYAQARDSFRAAVTALGGRLGSVPVPGKGALGELLTIDWA